MKYRVCSPTTDWRMKPLPINHLSRLVSRSDVEGDLTQEIVFVFSKWHGRSFPMEMKAFVKVGFSPSVIRLTDMADG